MTPRSPTDRSDADDPRLACAADLLFLDAHALLGAMANAADVLAKIDASWEPALAVHEGVTHLRSIFRSLRSLHDAEIAWAPAREGLPEGTISVLSLPPFRLDLTNEMLFRDGASGAPPQQAVHAAAVSSGAPSAPHRSARARRRRMGARCGQRELAAHVHSRPPARPRRRDHRNGPSPRLSLRRAGHADDRDERRVLTVGAAPVGGNRYDSRSAVSIVFVHVSHTGASPGGSRPWCLAAPLPRW